jgi:hypothetical protein
MTAEEIRAGWERVTLALITAAAVHAVAALPDDSALLRDWAAGARAVAAEQTTDRKPPNV